MSSVKILSPIAAQEPVSVAGGVESNETDSFIDHTTGAVVDGGAATYDDALYQPGMMARSARTLDAVTDDDIQFYMAEGYVAVDQAFAQSEIRAAMQGLTDLVMGKNPAFKDMIFESKARDILPSLTPDQRVDYVRKIYNFAEFDDRLKALAYHPKLLEVVHRILGDDELVLFSEMALLKPPRLGREKPWHQDQAYYDLQVETKVVGVWIALDEATVENGCMQLLPELRKRGAVMHFKRRDWQICDSEVMGRRSVAAPLKPGGLLFFDGLLPHGTPENRTPLRRRAVQYHYIRARSEKMSQADRLRIFGSEGKNVTC